MKTKLQEYKNHPFSMLMFILIILSAVIMIGAMIFIIGYILVRGIPNMKPELFECQFTSENQSMMPAIINTVLMTLCTLVMAVPVGVFLPYILRSIQKKVRK